MSRIPRTPSLFLLILALVASIATAAPQSSVPTPEEFFGFAMGTDEKLARWDKIVEYFELVATNSDRVRVDHYGPTTLGNPFILVVVTSAATLANIDRYVDIGSRLADGRSVNREQARALARQGKVTAVINHNIHSTEIGSSQTGVRLIYELATNESDVTRQIRDNVITVLIPSSNPDGQMMVTDWYEQNLGTDFEEAPMPYLYHHYAGHDNNRDFFMGNLVETRYMFKLMFDDWTPQVYLDQPQMGGGGARMFVPPFPDPQSPDTPPLMYQEQRLLGGGMVTDLQAAGKKGVITGEMYAIYGQEGALNWRFHNIVSLLTETASARIASPVEPDEEGGRGGGRGGRGGRGGGRGGFGTNPREFSVAVVDPWRGGRWSLGDIVEYQMIAARAFLKQAARNREDFLFNQWLMAQTTLQRAEIEGPYAWVIPADQSDPNTAADMVRRLQMQGIEVYQAGEAFEALPADGPLPMPGFVPPPPAPEEPEDEAQEGNEAEEGEEADEGDEADKGDEGEEGDEAEEGNEAEEGEQAEEGDEADEGDETEENDAEAEGEAAEEEVEPEPVTYAAGSFIIPSAQRGRPALIDLLEPRNPGTSRAYPDGPYARRYDSAAYTISMKMGVDVVRVDTEFDATIEMVEAAMTPLPAAVGRARRSYALDPRINATYLAVNRLLADGIEVVRSAESMRTDAGELPPGAFMIWRRDGDIHERLSQLSQELRVPVFADAESTGGDGIPLEIGAARIGLYKPWQASMDEGWTRLLLDNYEFPYENVDNARMREGDLNADFEVLIIPSGISVERMLEGISEERIMEPYAGGMGEEGIEAMIAFVDNGGTLLTFESSDEVVLERFEVSVKNSLEGLRQPDFYLPASLLNLEVNNDHPLGYGMGDTAYGFFGGGRAYEPDGWNAAAGNMRVVATYPEEDEVLASGQLIGSDYLAGRGAIVEVERGAGRIVMYGFRVQHRAQTNGTFKLLFNALYTGRGG